MYVVKRGNVSNNSEALWSWHDVLFRDRAERLRGLWPVDELSLYKKEEAIERLTLIELENKPFFFFFFWLITGSKDRPEIPTELQLRIIRRILALRKIEKHKQEILKVNSAR